MNRDDDGLTEDAISEQFAAQFYGRERTDGVRLEDRKADPCERVVRDDNAKGGAWRRRA